MNKFDEEEFNFNGYGEESQNTLINEADKKRDSNPSPRPLKLPSNFLNNIYWDKRRFHDIRTGVISSPSDIDDWTVEQKQKFLEQTLSRVDGIDFDDKNLTRTDFNEAMAMSIKATVALNTCPLEDIIRKKRGDNCARFRYPMTVGVDEKSLKSFKQIYKWIGDVMKKIKDYREAGRVGDPPPEVKFYAEYLNALDQAGISESLRYGGKRTRRKRGKKTKRAKTRRNRKRR